MNSLFTTHDTLAGQRAQYIKSAKEEEDNRRAVERTANSKRKELIFSKETELTHSELITLGDTLDHEYEKEIQAWEDDPSDHYGVGFDLINFAFVNNYEGWSGDEDCDSRGRSYRKGRGTARGRGKGKGKGKGKMKTLSPEKTECEKENEKSTSGENIKKVYAECIHELTSRGIKVYGVEKNLKGFKNRGWSALCGDTNVFVFYCRKNQYSFTVTFIDDCDCDPGILRIGKIRCGASEETVYDISCDMFCQNTSKGVLERVMILLESVDEQDFREKVTAKYTTLILSLENNGIEVTSKNISGGTVEQMMHLSFSINLKTIKGECKLMLSQYGDDMFHIGPILQKPEGEDGDGDDYSSPSSFLMYDEFHKKALSVKYRSTEDLKRMLKYIRAYQTLQSGEFGFLKDGVWYNHRDVVNFVTHKLNSIEDDFKQISCHYRYYDNRGRDDDDDDDADVGSGCKNESDNNMKDIDVTIHITLGYNLTPLYKKTQVVDKEYPVEFYTIRLTHDKNKDPTNCHLTIDGEYQTTDFKDEYYKDRENFIKNNKAIMSKYKHPIDKLEDKGNFVEMFNKIKYFVDKML